MKQSNVAGIVLSLMGLALTLFPNALWKITEKWKSHDAEGPTPAYKIILRVVGAVFLVAGILLACGILK